MLNRILCAVDASARAPLVFDAAAELAQKYGALLYVVRAINVPPEFPPAAATRAGDPLPAHLTRVAVLEQLELWKRAPGMQPTTPIVVVGQPWKVILDTARDLSAELIVIGSHGYHGWDRLLGTTAAKVVNLSDRNVLVVHGAHDGEAAS